MANGANYQLIFDLRDQITGKLRLIEQRLRAVGNTARNAFNGVGSRFDQFRGKVQQLSEKLGQLPGIIGTVGGKLGVLTTTFGLVAAAIGVATAAVLAFTAGIAAAIPKEQELLRNASVLSALSGSSLGSAQGTIRQTQLQITNAALSAGLDAQRAQEIFQSSIDEIASITKGNNQLFRQLSQEQALNLAFLSSQVEVTPAQVRNFTNQFLRASLNELKATEIGAAPGFVDFAEEYAKARGKIFDDLNEQERIALLTAFRESRTSSEFTDAYRKTLGAQLARMRTAFLQLTDFTRALDLGGGRTDTIIAIVGRIFAQIFDPETGILSRFVTAFTRSRLGKGADLQITIYRMLEQVEKILASVGEILPAIDAITDYFNKIDRTFRRIRNQVYLFDVYTRLVFGEMELIGQALQAAYSTIQVMNPLGQVQAIVDFFSTFTNFTSALSSVSLNPLQFITNPLGVFGSIFSKLLSSGAESKAAGLASSGAVMPFHRAVAAEMKAMPAGSHLVVANSSEVVLNREQFKALRTGAFAPVLNVSGGSDSAELADRLMAALDRKWHEYRQGLT